ncbi:hypothetical protein [Rhodococcus sp. NPDC058523]|uniref:hypothetical protein n=1 Tax=Rhodococcus sp. NPDC058523 TaxID=3346537 RepID=UPI0036670797
MIVYGADGTILGKSNLVADNVDPNQGPYCAFRVEMDGIKAGEAAYKVAIGEYDPVIASEDEMRRDPALFSARSSLERLWNNPPIEVSAPMTGSDGG